MMKRTYYMVDGKLLNELPENTTDYEKWLGISADDGYVLQNVLTYRTANRLLLRAGFEAFWREVLLGALK